DSGIPLEAVMNPLVSILIPAFNAQEWVADTLKSAMGQTWPRKEIIVVDDGSRDQTLAIARGLGSKEVSVVTQANQGAAATRNRAYSICQGDYIQWLDADDLLAPDKIARQMDAVDRGQTSRRSSLRHGATLCTASTGPTLSRRRSGAISRRSNGCSAS